MLLIAKFMLIIGGIIHLLPLPGLLGAAYLDKLYGITFTDPNVIILMRHRAVLFGLLGVFLIVAAFRPELFVMASVAGLISAASFIAIAWGVGAYNAAVARVVAADVIAVACLAVSVICNTLARQA